jgi:hypothetical protein
MGEDIIQVLRIVSYTGPRSEVERQIEDSLHGMRRWRNLEIVATTIGEFPKIIREAPQDLKKTIEDLHYNLDWLCYMNRFPAEVV